MPKKFKEKSPTAGPTSPLPASVKEAYRQRRIDLKKRIKEIELSRDLLISRAQRADLGAQRMKLERAILLGKLKPHTGSKVDAFERSPSPPPVPKDKPLHEWSRETGKGSRSKDGPKRPPNAYMIFCKNERDSIRERESGEDGFDMHKALARAWRDLKAEGQRPYFNEYEKHRQRYLEKVNGLKVWAHESPIGGYKGTRKRGGPAVSTPTSVVVVSHEAPLTPPGIINDQEQEDPAVQSQGDRNVAGFTAVNM